MLKYLPFLLFPLALVGALPHPEKILICGVCRNIEPAVSYTIRNIEELGSQFQDYKVIIYENNSTDQTVALLSSWAVGKEQVTFITENLREDELPLCRTEKIARARNIVLDVARGSPYKDYEFLIMVDLDFKTDWPIEEMINTIHSKVEWDAVSGNGVIWHGTYEDRYAHRDKNFPLGPELLGDYWINDISATWFRIDQDEWLPVYSAFGGIGIYKTKTILQFSYSGIVNEELKRYYRTILRDTNKRHRHFEKYLELIGRTNCKKPSEVPLIFRESIPSEHPVNYPYPTCCEHVTLHASMANRGYKKFYINPRMKFDRS